MPPDRRQPAVFLGVDLGKVSTSYVLWDRRQDPRGEKMVKQNLRHHGRPLDSFFKLYRGLDRSALAGIAATGVHSDLLGPPVLGGLPEEIAQEYATRRLYPEGPINILRLGARGFSLLTRDAAGRCRYEENDRCSSGAGETIERVLSRLGLELGQAAQMAEGAEEGLKITARCSVFATTEITHFANQGEPLPKLLAGYFQSVAQNLFAFYQAHKVEGPVVLIGNGALVFPVSDRFCRLVQDPATVSAEAAVYEALGALFYAAERSGEAAWPAEAEEMARLPLPQIRALSPAAEGEGSVVILEDSRKPAEEAPVILGFDLGSTGSKAVLWEPVSGAVAGFMYQNTRGNPAEAAKSLSAEILKINSRPVTAIGFTGSGREAAWTMFQAAYPESAEGLTVHNEIVAHATAAIHYDPDHGRSISIVEIGGQDAKFINVQSGQVRESNLNCACSAGTGSFLEEQARLYGIEDMSDFARMAAASSRPPELGQMCTVFVADLALQALNEGFSREDIFAGLQYSVILNYLNRVMGQRVLLEKIFFQGQPAVNPSLARTLAAVTGRQIYVPPRPGAMGAIGVALLVRKTLSAPPRWPAFDLRRILAARVTSRRFFQCLDQRCRNYCSLERATVEVGEEVRQVVSGGNCPKYHTRRERSELLPAEAPHPFRERGELVEQLLAEQEPADGPVVGIPRSQALVEFLPFFVTFFRKLGARPAVLRATSEILAQGHQLISSAGVCSPAKIMHGLAQQGGLDFLFLPKILEYFSGDPAVRSYPCPLIMSTPEMIREALRSRGESPFLLMPELRLGSKGWADRRVERELWRTASAVFRPQGKNVLTPRRFREALQAAVRKQQVYEKELLAIGGRALSAARQNGWPVVLVMGNLYVIHEPVMNVGMADIVTRNGAVALPLDCFPLPDLPRFPRLFHHITRRILRASMAAALDGSVFPLLLAGYGCGPLSFAEHFFHDLLEDYPHTFLESDGHGGQAGYVTRVQAFLHYARNHDPSRRPDAETLRRKARRYETAPPPDMAELKKSKIIVLGTGPRGGQYSAGVLRRCGFSTETAKVDDPKLLRLGLRTCSGKECLPHPMIFGALCRQLLQNPAPANTRSIFLSPTAGFGPCNNGLFALANEISLEKMGLAEKVRIITPSGFRQKMADSAGGWLNIVAADLLNQLRLYYRPEEQNPGEADRLFDRHLDCMEKELLQTESGVGPLEVWKKIQRCERLMAEAAWAFREMPKRTPAGRLPVVYVCGDIFVREDEISNDDLPRKLNNLGLRVLLQPSAQTFEFLAYHRARDLVELEDRPLRNLILRQGMAWARDRLVKAVNRYHPWVYWPEIKELDAESRPLLSGLPWIESMVTIGSVLHARRRCQPDGFVVILPWGCIPGHISEAQLRRVSDLPCLFLFTDGSPLDPRKLAAFAFGLRSK